MKILFRQFVQKTERYASNCHGNTNHKYDEHPYKVHLAQVVEFAIDFIHLIPEQDREDVIAACWVHDVIEDCRQTYNDVKKATNERVAEIAYALTNDKGKTRKERAGHNYYRGIVDTPYASFVKICDRLANVFYSSQTLNNRMFEVYKREYRDFKCYLYCDAYKPMFDHLQMLLHTKTETAGLDELL